MSSKTRAVYGQQFEDDEDGEKEFVSKKPTAIQDQIATDERGKRRFHGAFTGGFSAGFWNTVGSKHGWVPQEFKSSRDDRGERVKQCAEDFMDAEDLGEFGIGNRSIKRTSTFGERNRTMAWERGSESVSSIAKMLEDVVKPVSASIGIRMLREMGWREGKGIGLANVSEKKTRGGMSEEAEFDRQQAKHVAPTHEFSNEDVLVRQLIPLSGTHGLGYSGLGESSVLDEKFGQTALALKANKKGKGIRGQAFGVGAFEEEDESVYTNYDLSQYDFSVDVTGKMIEDETPKKVDSNFVKYSKQISSRKFYAAPRLPPNFRGEHKPIPLDTTKLPKVVQDDARNMTALQRAKFLGEDRISVMELVPSKDRKKMEKRSRWDVKVEKEEESMVGGQDEEDRDRRMRNRVEFPDEPMKQSRFKVFLQYVRRGLPYPQPTDLSVWEWESEKKEFESKLTVEERAMLPEVKSRSQPLVKATISAPIHEMMRNKFVKEADGELKTGKKDEDKLAAVKMGMFGERTRQSFEWYPANTLAKRFNVPNPYPGSTIVGAPALRREKKTTFSEMDFGLMVGMPNTEVEMREKQRRRQEESKVKSEVKEEVVEKDEDEIREKEESESEDEEKIKQETEKPPKSFFDYVFGDNDDSSDDDDDSDEEERKKNEREAQRLEELKRRREEIEKQKKLEMEENMKPTTSLRIEEDEVQVIEEKKPTDDINELYGPTLPGDIEDKKKLTSFSVLKYLQEDLKKRKEEKKKKHDKKNKKKSKKKKEKKHKKDKKKKGKKRDNSSSDSSDSSEWEETR